MNRIELYMTANQLYPDEIVSATDLGCELEIRGITGEGAYAIKDYCTRPTVERCSLCSLCNYGRDCHNNTVAK